jgi:putative oxidoreductase
MTTMEPAVTGTSRSGARDLLSLFGRVLICVIFVLAGFGKATHPQMYIPFMASKHLPLPQVGVWVAVVIELGGGLMLLFGLKARWAAAVMFLFLIPTTLLFHNFWAATPDKYVDQLMNFEKNLAIMGGLLMLVAWGPGRISIDGAMKRPSRPE